MPVSAREAPPDPSLYQCSPGAGAWDRLNLQGDGGFGHASHLALQTLNWVISVWNLV